MLRIFVSNPTVMEGGEMKDTISKFLRSSTGTYEFKNITFDLQIVYYHSDDGNDGIDEFI